MKIFGKVLIITFLLFVFSGYVKAEIPEPETINCYYDNVTSPDDVNIGTVGIVSAFNTEVYGRQYTNTSGELDFFPIVGRLLSNEEKGEVTDYKGVYSDIWGKVSLKLLLNEMTQVNGYIQENRACPTIYVYYKNRSIHVTLNKDANNNSTSYDSSRIKFCSQKIGGTNCVDSYSEYLKFFDSTYNEEENEPKECSYTTQWLSGEEGPTVVFKTQYEPAGDKTKRYMKVDDVTLLVENINEEFSGEYNDVEYHIVTADLKTAFTDGDCNEGPLYIYKKGSKRYLTFDKDAAEIKNSKDLKSTGIGEISDPGLEIGQEDMSCSDILGTNLTNIVKICITIARIAGAIITLLQASMALIPAIASGDAGDLKKAGKKCVYLAIILVIICLLPTFLKLIGDIGGFDLTCFA